jgi:tripartite-type tricarboxylate transporter receptor subunit TctC
MAPAAAQVPIADFYRGKTLTAFIGTVAGGEYDLHTRLVIRFIGKHIPGNPGGVAQNMAGGGGVMMANYFCTIPPKDGTQIAMINNALPLAQAMEEPNLKCDQASLRWLGTIAPTLETMALWHTTGVKSIEDARQKEIVIGASGKGSPTATFPRMMNELLGTKFKIVVGYPGGNEINLAMERGEVGGRNNTWSSWKATRAEWLAKKQIVIIAQGGITAKDLPGVPNVEDLARNDDDRKVMRLLVTASKLGRPLAATPGIPEDRLKALRDAFDATMKDPEFLAAAEQARVEVDPVKGVELQKMVDDLLATPKALIGRARVLVE